MEPISLWSRFCSLFSPHESILGRWVLEWDLAPDSPYHINDSLVFSCDGKFTEIYNRIVSDQTKTSLHDHTSIECGHYTLQDRVLTIHIDDVNVPKTSSWYIYSHSKNILVMIRFDPSLDGGREAVIAKVSSFCRDRSAKLRDHFNIYRRIY